VTDSLPDLAGQRAIVTGANSGIGYFTALELAKRGAEVSLACRNADKVRAAAARITEAAPDAAVHAVQLDLASLRSVRSFAESWSNPLDLLVNNAGVMYPLHRTETEDGFELQMGTNHLGHFALNGLLLPQLQAAPAPRVVTVSSLANKQGPQLNFDDLQMTGGYLAPLAYANSKLANLLFALELQRRAEHAGSALTSTAAHPGLSSTRLFSSPDGMGSNPLLRALATVSTKVLLQSPRAGARSTLAATSAAGGSYTGPGLLMESRGAPKPASVSGQAADPALAARMWEVSEELTGVRYDWSARP